MLSKTLWHQIMFLNFAILFHNGTKGLTYIYSGLYKSTYYILFIIELDAALSLLP